ncbi:hypothetical protein CAPTEDRAFT_198626 [Capitella teleta]|uniref:G-protein coupled receptors family 1 profile domain-containing protein n=1 Tax=Capitella teleta TaxID=283909 RepID=R7V5Y9_CAPTE|nr:hypothetical protein CAPTEDRAFT_198626 [Capitella teleta]|eukprot:ELU11751.1 hypothetical protein CAPTEDRAFT_198626 [Capitella teleta]
MTTTMETATGEAPEEKMERIQLTVVSVTLMFSSLTIIANPLTLVAMAMHGLIRKNSINVFIASLCLSDFLVGLSAFLFQLQQLLQQRKSKSQEIVAIAWTAAGPMVIGFLVSNFNAFFIGVDRACATLAPLSYKSRMTTKRAFLALVACWTTATMSVVLCAIPTVLTNGGFPMLTYPYEMLPDMFIKYYSTPMLIFCISINAILYSVIVIAFFKSVKKVQPDSTFELRNRRMTRMITMVIGVLLLGNIPIITVATIPTTVGSTFEYLRSYHMFYDLAFLLMVIPTSFNNCIYVWQLPDFKRAFEKIFCFRNFRVRAAVNQSI